MCIAKGLHSYKDNSPENLGVTTVQECMQNVYFWLTFVAQKRPICLTGPYCHRQRDIWVRDIRLRSTT